MRKIVFILLLLSFSGIAFCQSKKASASEKQPERKLLSVGFYAVFKQDTNGDIIARYPIQIFYYRMNKGERFPLNESICGVSLNNIKDHNLLIDTVKGVVIYKGYYHL